MPSLSTKPNHRPFGSSRCGSVRRPADVARPCSGPPPTATVAVDHGPLHRLATGGGLRTLPQRLEPKGLWFGFVDNDGTTSHLTSQPWHIGWGDLDHL